MATPEQKERLRRAREEQQASRVRLAQLAAESRAIFVAKARAKTTSPDEARAKGN